MAKRFTDTGIWNKGWFRKLNPQDKTAMFFVLSNCDAVGVWDADTEAAEFFIGAPVNWDELIERSNGNLERLQNGKIFVVDFCEFQYGKLSPECKPHQAYIRLLEKHGLKDRTTKGYAKGIHTLEEKEKEKDKEKETEKTAREESETPPPCDAEPDRAPSSEAATTYPQDFEEFWKQYPRREKKGAAAKVWKRDKLKPRLPQILDALARYKLTAQWKKDGGQYVPHASSWLSSRSYDDVPEPDMTGKNASESLSDHLPRWN